MPGAVAPAQDLVGLVFHSAVVIGAFNFPIPALQGLESRGCGATAPVSKLACGKVC